MPIARKAFSCFRYVVSEGVNASYCFLPFCIFVFSTSPFSNRVLRVNAPKSKENAVYSPSLYRKICTKSSGNVFRRRPDGCPRSGLFRFWRNVSSSALPAAGRRSGKRHHSSMCRKTVNLYIFSPFRMWYNEKGACQRTCIRSKKRKKSLCHLVPHPPGSARRIRPCRERPAPV